MVLLAVTADTWIVTGLGFGQGTETGKTESTQCSDQTEHVEV